MNATFPHLRLRRLRRSENIRRLVRENHLTVDHLVIPLFIKEGEGDKHPIQSMPGYFQFHLNHLAIEIKEIRRLKIPAVLLFGIPAYKDAQGSAAYSPDGIIQRAIREIKTIAPDLIVISDLCCCEYTNHAHCGIIEKGDVNNDATLSVLKSQAVSHAQAGADIIAPSGMMDGMVQAMRSALDENGHQHVAILSYAAKYASHFYGPFREAAGDTKPAFGDRRSYQMDFANGREALREVKLDINENADMIMVKPAGSYLDVIYRVKQTYPSIPLAAYQVSGEYSQIKAAAQAGFLDESAIMFESVMAIKRAGADIIISYFAKELAQYLNR